MPGNTINLFVTQQDNEVLHHLRNVNICRAAIQECTYFFDGIAELV